jgi:hypothetical protein
MAAEITTLQLARKIADAVAVALLPAGMAPNRAAEDARDPPTQAVIRVLHETGSWFCRWSEGEEGEPLDLPFEPVPEAKPRRMARLNRRGRKI